jgi:hypothetical protein
VRHAACGAVLCLLASACVAAPRYKVDFYGLLNPAAGMVDASITVGQANGELIALDFNAPQSHFLDFAGPGSVQRDGDRVLWEVPAAGGELRYRVRVDRRRGKRFDARMTDDWALFRLDDLFPSARTRARPGAASVSVLRLEAPEGWAIETRYGRAAGLTIDVATPERRFDRPTGWTLAGKLGIRREQVAGREVVVAAPRGTGYPRLPTLAFLRWTLPTLIEVFPRFPDHLLIVSAGDDMWRGALSGPASLYLHASRPLISENATSPLLHEMVHVGTRMSARRGDDWIVEGIAEFYGLEVLRRSGGISQERFELALATLVGWVERDGGALRHPSTGVHTARAVLLFHALDQELQAKGKRLDDLVGALLEQGPKVQRDALVAAAADLLGKPSPALAAALAAAQAN